MPLPRFLRLDRLAGPLARLARSQDTPAAPAADARTAVVTQDAIEQSTRVAQSLLDGGGLKPGQTVMIEGHRPMTVTVENDKVVLVPLEDPPTAA